MQLDKITLGSVIRIWHHPRGLDYVVVGEDLSSKELLLVKNNCLNSNGTIHGSTTKFHKRVKYSNIAGTNVVQNITRILGIKDVSDYDFSVLIKSGQRVIPLNKNFKTSAVSNNLDYVTQL